MKILVFSDTHGDISAMRDIITRNQADTDLVIHLGDHLKDLQSVMLDSPLIASLGVLGNCDFASMYPRARFEASFTAEKRRIFYTHGHKFNVKYGLDYIAANAKFNGADIVLYGHTHVPVFEERNGVTIINPGSLVLPRENNPCTYAVLNINGDKLDCKIMEI